MKNNSIIGKITEGFAESTRNVNTINKEYVTEIKADSKAVWDAAKEPDPGLVKVKEAQGLGGKFKAIGENIKDGCAEASENNKEYRAFVQSGEQYRTVLESSRELQQAIIGPAAIFNPYFANKGQRP